MCCHLKVARWSSSCRSDHVELPLNLLIVMWNKSKATISVTWHRLKVVTGSTWNHFKLLFEARRTILSYYLKHVELPSKSESHGTTLKLLFAALEPVESYCLNHIRTVLKLFDSCRM